jgi:hypothetical protein
MRLKNLGAALFVLVALGAVLASSAFAAAVTEDVKWYTGGGSGTLLGSSETVSSTIASSPATFTTHVAGTLYEIRATGINCLNCKMENSGGAAVGSGELEFTGVSVVQPAGCSIASTITTKPLSITADWMIGSTNYIEFEPTAGASTQFATVEVTGCALATNLVPKGVVYMQSANATATPAVEQEVHSSESINATASGLAKPLHVGTELAVLTGSAKFKMSGTHAGQDFQTFAAASTTDVKWYTGTGTGTELTTSETISSQIVGTTATLTTKFTTPIVIQATGISCKGCKIENSGGTAIGSGELEFTGVTVTEPPGCITPATFTTKPLSITADWMIGSRNYVKLEPTAGQTTAFATVTTTVCPLGTMVFKGTVFVESANATGTPAVEQEVHSSDAINTAAGGVAGTLHVGVEAAALTGSVKFKMTGVHAGAAFQTR